MATRGRKPKSAADKALRNDPGKRGVEETQVNAPGELPTCPAHLNSTARREWRRVAKGLHAAGLLTGLDRGALANYCISYSRIVSAEKELKKPGEHLKLCTEKGNPIQNPLVGVINSAMTQMKAYMVELGMTPSARTRLPSTAAEAQDEFEKWNASGKGKK